MRWSQLSTSETLILTIAVIIIWVSCSFLFLKEPNKKEGILRTALFSIALLFIYLIILRPQHKIEILSNVGLLQTENIKNVADSIPVFALSNITSDKNMPTINDLAELERNFPNIHNLYINGYGLEPEQLKHLKNIQVEFLAKDFPEGFNHLSYTRKIHVGEELQVSGRYLNNSTDSVKLVLETPEGLQDSIMIGGGRKDFFLKGNPVLTGNFVGNIKIYKDKNLKVEPLPYSVKPKKILRFIILQDFPSFEINYLKDWLAEQKHHIRIRTLVSRNKINTQQINVPAVEKKNSLFSKKNLEETDLIISDPESLKKLSLTEKKEILSAIGLGLGLLVFPDAEWGKLPEILDRKFPIIQSTKKNFILGGLNSKSKEPFEKLPFAFSNNSFPIPALKSNDNEILAAFYPEKNGKIAIQLAVDTYVWPLKGEDKLYNNYWTDIIQAIERKSIGPMINIKGAPFIWENNFSEIEYIENKNFKSVIQYQSGFKEEYQPKRDLPDLSMIVIPFRPVESNWMQLNTGEMGNVIDSLFIMPEDAWPDLRKSVWLDEYKKHQGFKNKKTGINIYLFKDIPLIWFFIPFIISICLLWWREREIKIF